MTTENFDLKVDDVIIGNDGMGDRIGYYIETKPNKHGIFVQFGSRRSDAKVTSRAVYSANIKHIRLATPEEVAEYENK
jgi:hypothetical protein